MYSNKLSITQQTRQKTMNKFVSRFIALSEFSNNILLKKVI